MPNTKLCRSSAAKIAAMTTSVRARTRLERRSNMCRPRRTKRGTGASGFAAVNAFGALVPKREAYGRPRSFAFPWRFIALCADHGKQRHSRRRARDGQRSRFIAPQDAGAWRRRRVGCADDRSEEHTSELQSLMRISYAVFRL